MKATFELEIEPFSTPNFVRQKLDRSTRRDGLEGLTVPLRDLDSATLARLCRDFENEVFRKAGKSPPPMQAVICRNCEKPV